MTLSLEGFCMFVLCPSQSEQTDCRYRRNTLHCTWRWRELRCAHKFSGQHWMNLMFFSFSSHLFRFLFPQIHGEWRCLAVCEVPVMALECVCFSFLGQMALGIRIAMSIFFFKTSLRFLFRKKNSSSSSRTGRVPCNRSAYDCIRVSSNEIDFRQPTVFIQVVNWFCIKKVM